MSISRSLCTCWNYLLMVRGAIQVLAWKRAMLNCFILKAGTQVIFSSSMLISRYNQVVPSILQKIALRFTWVWFRFWVLIYFFILKFVILSFYFWRQFHIFNTVSFVFVHVGLLQILELRPKIAVRFTWVWFRFWVLLINLFYIIIFVGLCWFNFFFFWFCFFWVYCYVLLACISSYCGKILKLVPFNIVFFFGGLWDSILNRVNKNMMVNNKILIWVLLNS